MDANSRLERLIQEKNKVQMESDRNLKKIQELSDQVATVLAENKTLRTMTEVPENFGVKIEEIKAYDKQKVEDYIKIIQVLQEDNMNLEKERANLKNRLKMMAIVKKEEGDSRVRYNGLNLTQTQLNTLDNTAVAMAQGGDLPMNNVGGEAALKLEIERLKKELNEKGAVNMGKIQE